MAYKMTKCGSLDNETTNEFWCDTIEDRDNIPAYDINLGTVAVILEPTMQVFIANSKKQWVDIIAGGGSNSSLDTASSPTVDQGRADSMVLQE